MFIIICLVYVADVFVPYARCTCRAKRKKSILIIVCLSSHKFLDLEVTESDDLQEL